MDHDPLIDFDPAVLEKLQKDLTLAETAPPPQVPERKMNVLFPAGCVTVCKYLCRPGPYSINICLCQVLSHNFCRGECFQC